MSVIARAEFNLVEQTPGRDMTASLMSRIRACMDWLEQVSSELMPTRPEFHAVMQDEAEAEEIAMQQTIFCYGASVLALRLMRADGEPNSKERTSFLALFTLAGMGKSRLSSLLAAAARDEAPTLQYARQLNGLLEGDVELRREMMERLARLALADAPLDSKEFSLLSDIGKVMGFNRPQVARLVMEADSPMSGSAWEVLRVKAPATRAEIQAAYHERVRYCHPDRWQGKEEYKELHRLATIKAAAVNEAYHTLTQEGKRRRR